MHAEPFYLTVRGSLWYSTDGTGLYTAHGWYSCMPNSPAAAFRRQRDLQRRLVFRQSTKFAETSGSLVRIFLQRKKKTLFSSCSGDGFSWSNSASLQEGGRWRRVWRCSLPCQLSPSAPYGGLEGERSTSNRPRQQPPSLFSLEKSRGGGGVESRAPRTTTRVGRGARSGLRLRDDLVLVLVLVCSRCRTPSRSRLSRRGWLGWTSP